MREVGETALRHGESGFRGFRIDEDGVAGTVVEGEKPMRDCGDGIPRGLIENGGGVRLDPEDDEERHDGALVQGRGKRAGAEVREGSGDCEFGDAFTANGA